MPTLRSLSLFPDPPRRRLARLPRRRLDVVGLFAGIGGIELGMERAGHRAALLCEIDPAAVAVLEKRFPGVPIHRDVRALDNLPASTGLLTAGFPCQDLSQAGMTAGIEGSRSGLVTEVFRLLDRSEVSRVLLENVPFMLRLGKGKALDVIVRELERRGFRWAYRIVNALAFGVPQRRERVFIYACRGEEDPRHVLFGEDEGEPPTRTVDWDSPCGFYWTEGTRGLGLAIDSVPTLKGGSAVGIPSPPAIVLPSGTVITPVIRDAERLQGFPADFTLPALTVGKPGIRWKLVGNAVSVPVSTWLAKKILAPTPAGADVSLIPLAPGTPWPTAAFGIGDGTRYAVEATTFPVRKKPIPLLQFLREPGKPLSVKATAGFLKRAREGSLRFPMGFLDRIEQHLEQMSSTTSAADSIRRATRRVRRGSKRLTAQSSSA